MGKTSEWLEDNYCFVDELRDMAKEADAVLGAISQGHSVDHARLQKVKAFLSDNWGLDELDRYPRVELTP